MKSKTSRAKSLVSRSNLDIFRNNRGARILLEGVIQRHSFVAARFIVVSARQGIIADEAVRSDYNGPNAQATDSGKNQAKGHGRKRKRFPHGNYTGDP